MAIVNTLLLQDDIDARTVQLESQYGTNSTIRRTQVLRNVLQSSENNRAVLRQLIDTLVDYILQYSGKDSATIALVEANLPSLINGLDVNLNLIDGTCSKDGLAHDLFSSFGISFVHGWCRKPDPDSECDTVFNELQMYDSLQDYQLRESTTIATDIQEWLLTNGTQLTEYGLENLDRIMPPDLVSVFFRNNHFSTLYKGNDHDFYILITDGEFSKHQKYVWQSLNSISGGEDLFFTGDLLPIFEDSDIVETPADEADRMLAKELQQEEDSAMAAALQKEFNKTGSKSKHRPNDDKKEKKQKKEKKKSMCVIS